VDNKETSKQGVEGRLKAGGRKEKHNGVDSKSNHMRLAHSRVALSEAKGLNRQILRCTQNDGLVKGHSLVTHQPFESFDQLPFQVAKHSIPAFFLPQHSALATQDSFEPRLAQGVKLTL
jgi:hypothetical protein